MKFLKKNLQRNFSTSRWKKKLLKSLQKESILEESEIKTPLEKDLKKKYSDWQIEKTENKIIIFKKKLENIKLTIINPAYEILDIEEINKNVKEEEKLFPKFYLIMEKERKKTMIVEVAYIEGDLDITDLFFIEKEKFLESFEENNNFENFDEKKDFFENFEEKFFYKKFLEFLIKGEFCYKPDFNFMDDDLEKGILEFLVESGIDSDFLNYVQNVSGIQNEYLCLEWFKNFKLFVENSFIKKN